MKSATSAPQGHCQMHCRVHSAPGSSNHLGYVMLCNLPHTILPHTILPHTLIQPHQLHSNSIHMLISVSFLVSHAALSLSNKTQYRSPQLCISSCSSTPVHAVLLARLCGWCQKQAAAGAYAATACLTGRLLFLMPVMAAERKQAQQEQAPAQSRHILSVHQLLQVTQSRTSATQGARLACIQCNSCVVSTPMQQAGSCASHAATLAT